MTINTCTLASHAALKRDRVRYLAATVPAYWMADVDEGGTALEWEFRNCLACKSSLNDGTARPLLARMA